MGMLIERRKQYHPLRILPTDENGISKNNYPVVEN